MTSKYHPLRPLGVPVLVCEGPDDYQFLNGILSHFAPEIYISEAGGKDNVNLLANILKPAVCVKDRDFSCSEEDAQKTLKSEHQGTYWSHPDLEAYLLYEDWLISALYSIQQSPKGGVQNMPADEHEVSQNITEIADYFVADHAGRQTLEELTRLAKPIRFYAVPKHGVILRNAEASDQSTWENCLIEEAARLRQVAKELAELPALASDEVVAYFDSHLQQYTIWAKNIATAREHFSGKRIFRRLTLRWQIRIGGTELPWETFRNEVMKQAINYSQSIGSSLVEDPRLRDIGLLANKTLNLWKTHLGQ